MSLGALIIQARPGLTDEELVELIKEIPYFEFFIGLDAFQNLVLFDPSMMVYLRNRLAAAVVNDCRLSIVFCVWPPEWRLFYFCTDSGISCSSRCPLFILER